MPWDQDPLKSPPSLGYPAVPPNWEAASQMEANKPSTQAFVRVFQEAVWGGSATTPPGKASASTRTRPIQAET